MTTASVVIPTYNRAEILSRTLDSVCEQTFQDFEIVVVDDGSTDETDRVVSEYPDDRIRYVSNDTNQGPSAARNTGVRVADGEYLSFLDSDDELKPTFLERSIETLRSEPSECAGTFVSLEIYRDGEVVDLHGTSPRVCSPADFGTSIETEARTGGLTVRAAAIGEAEPFDEDIAYMDDVAFWIELLREHYLVGIDEPLYRYHRHDDQITGSAAEKIEGLNTFLEEYHHDLPPSYRGQYRYILGQSYVRQRELPSAATEFRKAVMEDPRRAPEVVRFLFEKGILQLSYVPSYLKSRVIRPIRRSDA